MSKNSKKKLKWFIPIAVLSVTCASIGVMAGCTGGNNGEHTHNYEWQYDGDEHWKECLADGTEEEGSRGEHVFVLGECECGATEAPKTYGKVTGSITLRKLGGTETNFNDVTVDMGDDDVELTLNKETGTFTADNVVVGKKYSLTVSKPGYEGYAVTVQLENEGETVAIGGTRGIVLEYKAFDFFMGWDGDLHDMSHVNDANPFITHKAPEKGKSFDVITNESYEDVAVTYHVKRQNSLHGWHLQGLAFRFDDGKHLAIRYQGGNNHIQITNNQWGDQALGLKQADSLFGEDANLNQYGEKGIYDVAADDAALNSEDGLPMTAVLKDGKLTVLINGVCYFTYQLPAEYAQKKAKVLFYAYDPAQNAVFSYNITEEIPSLDSALDIKVTKPEGVDCSVTATPQKDKYAMGDKVELTLNAASGYQLDEITVNGVDMYKSVKGDKLTITADRATVEVKAKFVEMVEAPLNLTVKGKKFGKTETLAKDTEVTLSNIDTPFTVNADGKITADSIAFGRYTVSAEGYLEKEITIDETTTEVVLEYDAFNIIVHDAEDHDLSHVNEDKPYIQQNGPRKTMDVISKEKLFNDVSVSVTLKTSTTTDGDQQQGVILQFEDGKAAVLNINTAGTPRLQFRPNLWEKYCITAFTSNWVEFKNVTPEEVEKYRSETGVKLTLERRGSSLYVFLDGVFHGKAELPAEYADDKVGFGFFAFEIVPGSKWYFEVSETLSDIGVTVNDGTAQDAGGTISISENPVLGGKVFITVTPDATHAINTIVVSGGIIPEIQEDGTYMFVAEQTEYTVTATFMARPATEAQANVSVIDLGNTPVDFEGGAVTFVHEERAPVNLYVTDGKIKGGLLPGEYTVSIKGGYYALTVTVDENGAFEGLTNGLKFEKEVFKHNMLGDGGIGDATKYDYIHAAEEGCLTVEAKTDVYAFTVDRYNNAVFTAKFKKQNGGQGLFMAFGTEAKKDQQSVGLNIEGNNLKFQGNWLWGLCPIAWEKWEFGPENSGADYARPMSDALLTKYAGEGIEVSLVRKDGAVYVFIEKQLYAIQALGDYGERDVCFAIWASNAEAGYKIPFTVTDKAADVDKMLSDVTNENGVRSVLGNWTITDDTIGVSGGNGFVEFTHEGVQTKELLTVNLKTGYSNGGNKAQGILYRFTDGKWLAVRIERKKNDKENLAYIQYSEDSLIPSGGGCLKTGWGKAGNRDLTAAELAAFDDADGNGIDLTLYRDGKTFYVLLGGTLLDKFSVDDKYAAMDGMFGATIENGTGTAFAYEHSVGVPEGCHIVNASIEGDAHSYAVSIDKLFVQNDGSVTVTIRTSNANTAWSYFPNAIKVNGTAVDFTQVTKKSLGANRCEYTFTLENVTADSEIVVTVAKGTQIAYDASVNNAEYGSVVCDMEAYGKEYYWNDLCTWTITAKDGYVLEKIVLGEGATAQEITEGWTVSGNVYTYKYTVTGDVKAVMHFKAAETEQPGVNAVSKFEWADMGANAVNLDSADYKYYEIYGETTTAQTGKNDLILQENVSTANVATDNLPNTVSGSGASIQKGHEIDTGSSFTFKIKVVKGMEKIQIFFRQATGATITASYTMNGNTGSAEVASNGAFQMVKITLDTTALEEGEEYEITVTVSSSANGLQCACCGIRSATLENNATAD